jgi:hypothetical protein
LRALRLNNFSNRKARKEDAKNAKKSLYIKRVNFNKDYYFYPMCGFLKIDSQFLTAVKKSAFAFAALATA